MDKNKIWRCLDGTEIPITDLEVGHLCNIVAMLKRNAGPYLEANGLDPEEYTCLVYPHFTALNNELRKRIGLLSEALESGAELPAITIAPAAARKLKKALRDSVEKFG